MAVFLTVLKGKGFVCTCLGRRVCLVWLAFHGVCCSSVPSCAGWHCRLSGLACSLFSDQRKPSSVLRSLEGSLLSRVVASSLVQGGPKEYCCASVLAAVVVCIINLYNPVGCRPSGRPCSSSSSECYCLSCCASRRVTGHQGVPAVPKAYCRAGLQSAFDIESSVEGIEARACRTFIGG